MNLSELFKGFFNSEKTGGFILIFCTLISLLLANSSFGYSYNAFWETDFNGHSLTHWINDGLMSIFFLLIGLELEREIFIGELSDFKSALLPVIAAIGGVVIPASIYLLLNYGTPEQAGTGIPMATDIAFAIGVLSLLGSRVPASLKLFLTALAVIDDLLAILVIAVFYSSGISLGYLGAALGIWALLFLLNRLKIHNLVPYLVGGVMMWYCMLHSGIHATIAGVLLAFAIPFGKGGKRSTSYLLQHFLHKPVAFVILPIFALANTALVFEPGWAKGLFSMEGLGIFCGLVLGKPIGILLFSFAAVAAGFCVLPGDLRWKHITGAALLAGIGFTMSIFITMLAFSDSGHIAIAKTAIIFASLFAALLGLGWLLLAVQKIIPQQFQILQMNTMANKTKTIVISGLTAAILDIAAAIIVYAFVLSLTTPQRVLQSVAAGALGKKSFSGGWNTALLGLALHTLIALIFAGFYCLIYPYWTRIFKNTFVAGFVYGCLVWCIMNFGVLPIANGNPFVFNMKFFMIGIGLIIFCVGIPIAVITQKILRGNVMADRS